MLSALPVIRDAQDSDPGRLYKATFESGLYGNRLAVAFSADGLRWTLPPHNPVGEPMEQTGLAGRAPFGPDLTRLATIPSVQWAPSPSACGALRLHHM